MSHNKPPCGLLMLPGVTPAYKGMNPLAFSNLPIFTIQGTHMSFAKMAGDVILEILNLRQQLKRQV
ncbi:MAG: hypothetical protein ACO1N7_01885 [Sphingobacteriaceae bacterium]